MIAGSAVLGHQLSSLTLHPAVAPPQTLGIDNPYVAGGSWYRGNLHVASVRGLGRDLPSAIGRWYAAHGYAFLAISDMNTYTWAEEYGSRTFVALPTVDASYPFSDVLAVEVGRWLPASSLQGAVDWIAQDGGLPVLAAPLSPAKPQDAATVLALKRLFGLEVYDARLAAESPAYGDATTLWDRLLSTKHRVFAFAGDDAMSLDDPAIGRGFIEVLSPSPDLESLLSSLRQGAFVASSGAEFVSLRAAGTTISAEAGPGCSLRFIGRGGRLLETVNSRAGSYRARGDEGYVRVEAVRDDGTRAWSQPFFLSWR